MPGYPGVSSVLETLSTCGVALSAEMKAALATSLKLKAVNSMSMVVPWGKIVTTSGADYLVCTGMTGAHKFEGKAVLDYQFYYSQDGVTWCTLAPCPAESKAPLLSSMLSGEPGKVYTYLEEVPAPEPEEPAEGEEPVEPEAPEPIPHEVTEMERLAYMCQSVMDATACVPEGYFLLDAGNNFVANAVFPGLAEPTKLSSYLHFESGASLANDVSGSWAVTSDAFEGKTYLKSLAYPGYYFFYGSDGSFGNFYQGTGLPNKDLAFML